MLGLYMWLRYFDLAVPRIPERSPVRLAEEGSLTGPGNPHFTWIAVDRTWFLAVFFCLPFAHSSA